MTPCLIPGAALYFVLASVAGPSLLLTALAAVMALVLVCRELRQ
jgi:hypothetical protein